MSIGTVAVRYAKALLAYAVEKDRQDEVYSQMQLLSRRLVQYPDIMGRIADPTVPDEPKCRLLFAAMMSDDGSPACDVMEDFVRLVVRAGRGEALPFMASSYRDMYRRKYNVVPVEMTVAHHLNDSQRAELEVIIRRNAKSDRIEWNESVRPELLGGFMLQIDDYRLDASVARKLRIVEKELIEKNSRII